MRLVMMGTGPFGVPTFRGLYAMPHTVVALVTGPLRPARGRRPVPASPMRSIAHEFGTPIFDPEDVNSDESRARLVSYQADLLVVCDYGAILSADTLATTRLGGINLHGSLLPRYRGAAPVNWAIYNGETETGVSVIHMTPELDAGPVIAQDRTPIDPDETAEQLENRLAAIGAREVRLAIESLDTGRVETLSQDRSQASKARRLKKTDGLIDWSRPAVAIKNQIRAMQPWPKAFTFWHRPSGKPVRLIIGPVSAVDSPEPDAPAGSVLQAVGDRLVLAVGQGAVALKSVQPAGKHVLSVAEFLRGYRVKPGEKFGPAQ